MNKKAGLLISTIILAVVLVAGIVVGLRWNDNSDELVDLQEQVQQLQLDLENAEKECKEAFMERYTGAGVADDYFYVEFINEKTEEEKLQFANGHSLTIKDDFSPPNNGVYLNVPDGEDIYEVMCSIKLDSEVFSVQMDITSLGGNFQGV